MASEGCIVSVHGSRLVGIGDEQLSWSGPWTGKLTHPLLGYRGEMGYIDSGRNSGAFAITESACSDGSRSVMLFNSRTIAFDGQLLHLRAPAEDLGSENELWCGVSDLSAIQAMAMAAASDALKEHHKAECELSASAFTLLSLQITCPCPARATNIAQRMVSAARVLYACGVRVHSSQRAMEFTMGGEIALRRGTATYAHYSVPKFFQVSAVSIATSAGLTSVWPVPA